MDKIWKKYYSDNVDLFDDDLYKQVGKTVNGVSVNKNHIGYIINDIVNGLDLSSNDCVVDFCCGNGLITKEVSIYVKRAIGVDFSEPLIHSAIKNSSAPNISYLISDVEFLSNSFFQLYKKFYMYEALQHFSIDMLSKLLEKYQEADDIKIFIASIPDKRKIWDYYNTDEKKSFYFKMEEMKTPHMGKWWDQKEILELANKKGFSTVFSNQSPLLYTSYYRFNCLLIK